MINFLRRYLSNETKAKILHRLKAWRAAFHADDLNKLATVHGSDKWGGHWYTQHYDFHFKDIRFNRLKIFEIGVGGYDAPYLGGSSLRMWKSYFPNGRITALDIIDKSLLNERRIKIYQGSQADPELLRKIHAECGPFDIIIDDGSHRNDHVIQTFEVLFPLLKDQGIYVVEDTQTSYFDEFGGDAKDLANPATTMNYFKRFIDKLNYMEHQRGPAYRPDYYELNIHSIHFYHNLIVIHKKLHGEKSNLA